MQPQDDQALAPRTRDEAPSVGSTAPAASGPTDTAPADPPAAADPGRPAQAAPVAEATPASDPAPIAEAAPTAEAEPAEEATLPAEAAPDTTPLVATPALDATPLDATPAPAEAPADPDPVAAATPAATASVSPPMPPSPDKPAKRPLVPMAAFDRIPMKWLVVAGSAVVVLIVAIAAVVLLTGPSKPPNSAAPGPGAAGPGGSAPSGPAPTSPGSATAPGAGGSPGSTVPGPGAPAGGNQAAPPTSVDGLRALLIAPPGTDSTVDTGPIDDTTFEGTRWGVTQFWSNPEGSMVLAQYGTADQAREALTQYRDSINVSGICDERGVPGHADAYLCAAKDLGEGVNPGNIPAIGVGVKGTIVALVTASDPTVVQQLLVKQLDRLP